MSWTMRAIRTSDITFGLVNVPVKLYSATRSHDLSLHQVHDKDHGRIRYERRCDVCGRVVDHEHIDKAFDDGDKTVILSDEELDSLPAEDDDDIEVVQFVPGEQIDPVLLGTTYLLEPVGRSRKSYVLLRRALETSDLTAVVTFTLRSKTHLGVLRTRDNLLALQTMRWPEDVREAEFDPGSSKISEKELDLAGALVDQFTGDFEPERFSDEYQDQLRELVEEKLEHGDSVDTDATFGKERAEQEKESGGKVLSLMDALNKSVAGSRAKAGSTKATDRKPKGTTASRKKADGAKASSAKAATKSAGPQKTGTAKTGTKKTTAKKSTAKSSAASKTKASAKAKKPARKSA